VRSSRRPMTGQTVCTALAIAFAAVSVPSLGTAQTATILPPAASAAQGLQRYQIDTDHSSLEFRVKFMGLSTVRGAFQTWEGAVMIDPAHTDSMTATIAIAAESISTGVPARDRDLRSDHFFDTKKFPYITFTSTRVVTKAPGGYALAGELTMHGVVKPVVIALVPTHPLLKDAWGNQRLGFTGTTTIDRKDFGIEGTAFWNNEFDPGRRAIADEIAIDAAIELELVNMGSRAFPKADALIKQIDAGGLAAALTTVRAAAPDLRAPEFAAYHAMLANAALKLRQAGRYADGAALCGVLVAIDNKDAEALAALAELELLGGDKKRAAGDFKRAIAADPTNTVAAEYLRHL